MDNNQLYMISKYVFGEAFTISQLNYGGVNQARILEKMEDDAGYIRSSSMFVKVIVSIYLALMVILPIHAFDNIQQALARGIPLDRIIIIGTLEFGAFFLFQASILLFFNVFLAMGIFSKEAYEWLYTLPLEKNELEKVGLFALFRAVNAPVVIMFFLMPVGVGLITGNFIMSILAVGYSIINILFDFALLTLSAQKFQKLMTLENNSRASGIVRFLLMLGYILFLFISILSVSLLPEWIAPLYQSTTSIENSDKWITILAYIPFPTNNAITMIMVYLSITSVPVANYDLVFPLMIGTALMIILAVRLFKTALKRLDNIMKTGTESLSLTPQGKKAVRVEISSPIGAYFKKDLKMLGRDIQMLIWALIPLAYGVLSIFMSLEDEDSQMYPFLHIFYMILAEIFIIVMVSKVDSDGGTIMAALPIVVREQVKAKIIWMPLLIILGFLSPFFIFIGQPRFITYMLISAVIFPLMLSIGIFIFQIKIMMFGKLKHKYVVEEINKANMVGKWAVIIFLTGMAGFVISETLWPILKANAMYLIFIYYGPTAAVIIIVDIVLFNYLFPKPKKITIITKTSSIITPEKPITT